MFIFGIVLQAVVTLMLAYVTWRAASVPFVRRHVRPWVLVALAALIWVLMAAGRLLAHGASGPAAAASELAAMDLMGFLFITTVCLVPADVMTGFGFLFPKPAPTARGLALLAGLALSATAVVQGMRPPVVDSYEVSLAGLPPERDGTVLVALSDTHLGTLIGEGWLAGRLAQVKALKPDIVVLLGDIVEGRGASRERFLPVLSGLSAPLGVWAVTGNHEAHGRRGGAPDLLGQAGFRVLHDAWGEACPGLVLSGVDDLTARSRSGDRSDPVEKALSERPPGATIFLSHTPWRAEEAARLGAGLMLSAHTHGGQIWPFGYLVRLSYPLVEGRYDVGGMPVIVCRGTGTWGPRMRLWRPGEILRITLRSPAH